MWKNLAASWAILLGMGFMMTANGLQGTLLGVRATMEGFSTLTIGVVMSSYFIGIFAGSLITPYLVKRVGHIRVFSALASLASISILFHGIFINAPAWMALRIITGICFAGFYVVTESWLNDRASNENRGKVLSVYMLVITIGLGSGQFLLNLSHPDTMGLFILISVIISAGLIPVLLTAKPAPAFESSAKMSLVELYRASPLAVIATCLTGMVHGTIFGLGSIYASAVLVDIKLISWFMACFMLGSLVFQWPIGYLSDIFPRRAILAVLSVVSITASVVAVAIPKDGPLFYATVMLLGGVAIPLYSICIAYANDRLEPQQIVSASGALVTISGIGLSTGPIVVAFFMDIYGAEFFFWGIAGIFVLFLGFTLLRIQSTDGISAEEQSQQIASGPIGTPIAEYYSFDAIEYAEAMADEEIDLPENSEVE